MRDWFTRLIASPKFKPAFYSMGFTIVDTALYFFSQDNFWKHIGKSNHRVSELKSVDDKIYLTLMAIGNVSTLIATFATYYVIIKNFEEGRKRKLPSHSWLMFFTILSIINKSIGTSSSTYALTNDHTSEAKYLWPVFGLSFVSNVAIQTTVQMESMRKHASFPKWFVIPFSFFATTIYNFSLLSLNWNTLNNVFITFSWIKASERVSIGNMFESDMAKAMVGISAPFFISAAIRNEMKFIPFVIERLTPEIKGRETSAPSIFNKVMGLGNALQRTIIMFLSFAALIFVFCSDDNLGYLLGFGLALLCLPGNAKANIALLFPKLANVIRLSTYPYRAIDSQQSLNAIELDVESEEDEDLSLNL